MTKPVVFMYSGQGAQYYWMGRELYREVPVFKNWMDRMDDMVRPLVGASITEMLYRDRADRFEPFDRTLFTQCANVMIGVALTEVLYSRGLRPDFLIGYSLGEMTSAIVAGSLTPEEGLAAAVRQAQLVEAHTPDAGMIAVMADPGIMDREPDLFAGTWLACWNFANHIVVTGYRDQLRRIETALKARNITCQILPISQGFHSPLMAPVEPAYRNSFLDAGPPLIPLYSASTGEEIELPSGDTVWQAASGMVDYHHGLPKIEALGPYTYVDVGPAGTMATFTKYNLPADSGSVVIPFINQFGKDLFALDKVLDSVRQQENV